MKLRRKSVWGQIQLPLHAPLFVALQVGGLLTLSSCTSVYHSVAKRRAIHARADPSGMILIKGGRFCALGSCKAISPFHIDETEVTVQKYAECTQAGICTTSGDPISAQTHMCNTPDDKAVKLHPINCVTYMQAEEYCHWRGSRLPTLEEWRWVATNRWRRSRWPWGNVNLSFPPRCIEDSSSRLATCEVGCGDRSIDGVADLAANIAEWVSWPGHATMGHSDKDTVWSERSRVHDGGFVAGFASINVGFRCARD